jgi:hypothetical protein
MNVPITNAFNLNYFWKTKLCTADYLKKLIESNPILKNYLPDDYTISRLSRDFIFTLFKTVTPDLYTALKNDVNVENDNNRLKKFENAYIELDEDVLKSVLEKKELKVCYTYLLM